MANTTLNPYKYNNRTAIDGKPLEPGKVLVPWWIQDGYEFKPGEKKHCTIIRIGEFKFTVGFIQINIECYETYMKGFNAEINNYMKERREGRCIIGYKKNGEPICCPNQTIVKDVKIATILKQSATIHLKTASTSSLSITVMMKMMKTV